MNVPHHNEISYSKDRGSGWPILFDKSPFSTDYPFAVNVYLDAIVAFVILYIAGGICEVYQIDENSVSKGDKDGNPGTSDGT